MDIIRKFESKKGHSVTGKEENGILFLEAESAAKGLGFVQVKNGKEYIRWDRVNQYIDNFRGRLEFDEIEKVGKGDFIREETFYFLAMKAENEAGRIFQTWISVEVLPSLRKQNYYVSDTITPAQIKQAKKYLTEKGLKSLFKNTDEENIISEYRLARQAAGDKKQFDAMALELLQKRPLGANSNKLIYKIINKERKALIKQNKKLQDYIRSIEPADDEYTVLDYHGISVNYMYTGNGAELKKTERYKEWLEGFPVDQLPSVENIDFKKPVNMWLKFNHDKRYDVSNLHKGLIDVMCNHWGKNDKLVQLKSCITNEYTTKEEGKIFICIKQGVDIS